MTNGILGEFRVGEDIAIALDATEGDAAQVTAIDVRMKPALVADNRIIPTCGESDSDWGFPKRRKSESMAACWRARSWVQRSECEMTLTGRA